MTSRSSQERTQAALAKIPEQEYLSATFVSQTGTQATVNQGTNTIKVRSASQYPLIPGDAVRLQRRSRTLVMLGPSLPRAATGRITATGSPRCTVEYPNGSGVSMLMGYNPSYTPVIGDIVLISWDAGGGTVQFKPTAVPTPTVPPVASGSGPVTYHPAPFTAIDSGSFNTRWSTLDIYASDSYIGAWFYGSKIKDTIPDSATILSSRLYLPLKQKSGAPAQLGHHPAATKPAGTVAVTGTAALAVPGSSSWVDIPTALIDFLKANDGGLGFNHGGYNIFTATGRDGLSGALDITYQA